MFDAVARCFILKNGNCKTFADASAMAAVSKLDGTQGGVQTANTVATAGPLGSTKPNGYNFDTIAISNITTGYATSLTGTYDSYSTASASPTNTYRFISVVATQNVNPEFPSGSTDCHRGCRFGQGRRRAAGEVTDVSNAGLVPFAPDAFHNASNTTTFGFVPGQEYTLKCG